MMDFTNAKNSSEGDLQLAPQRAAILKAILDNEDPFKWWPDAPKMVSAWESGEFCDLRRSDLSNLKLGKLMMGECVLDEGDFSNSELSETALQGSSASRANFTNAKLYRTQMIPFYGEHVDFTRAAFRQVALSYAKLLDSTFTSATLDDVSLSHTDVSRSSFVGARFNASRLGNGVFRETDLSNAVISNCSLGKVTFQNALMMGTVLEDCEMRGTDFRGASLDRALICGGEFGIYHEGSKLTPTRFDDTPQARRLVAESGAKGIDIIEWCIPENNPLALPSRLSAGEPCTRNGFWFTPAKIGSRRYFNVGDAMPEVGGAWGTTFWQWDQNQDPPKLRSDE